MTIWITLFCQLFGMNCQNYWSFQKDILYLDISNWTAVLNTTWHSLVVLRTVTEHGGLVVATGVGAITRVIYYGRWLDTILFFFFNLNKQNQFSNKHVYQATLKDIDSYLEILQYCSHQGCSYLLLTQFSICLLLNSNKKTPLCADLVISADLNIVK